MENIKDIMDMEIERTQAFSSMEKVSQFDSHYDIHLPTDYAQFLFEYGGRFVEENYYYKALERSPYTSEDGYDSASYFFGNDIVENMDIYGDEWEQKLIPIAEVDGGDFICLGVKDDYIGKIFFWMHDNPREENLRDELFLVANSFKEFMKSFVKREQFSSFSSDDIIKIEMDDDLLID